MKNKYAALSAGFITVLCTGILYLWSVFQPYVVSHFNWESAKAAQTSSVLLAFFVIGNIVSGWLQHRIAARYIALLGGLCFSAGLFLTSLIKAENCWLIYLSYGGVSGLGCGLSYSLSLDMLQKHFKSRKGLITGFTVSMFGLSLCCWLPL
jgi:OFA family oxalate/formate antiporter-like MFS transporter